MFCGNDTHSQRIGYTDEDRSYEHGHQTVLVAVPDSVGVVPDFVGVGDGCLDRGPVEGDPWLNPIHTTVSIVDTHGSVCTQINVPVGQFTLARIT